MKRDLGTLGESTLTSWAAARGISAQRVTNDRTGWDFLLEFSSTWPSEFPDLPRDKEPASISCLVQVKAINTSKLNRPVKLANWQRLINSAYPAFFLVLDFGSNDSPQRAYLVPVDAMAISRVLRRIRELDSQSEDIAKHKLSVICQEQNRLASPNGESLEKAIRSHIGSSLKEYIQKKAEWIRAAGYETTTGLIKFTVRLDNLSGTDLVEDLVDLSLGLREPLEVSNAEIRDVRFNIPAREPHIQFSAGTLDILREPTDQVEVTLRCRTSVLHTKMELFLPRGLASITGIDRLKVLLKNRFVDLVLGRSQGSIRFHIPGWETRAKLCDLHDLANVLLLLHEAVESREAVNITARMNDKLSLSSMRINDDLDPEVFEVAAVVRDAWAVTKHLDIHERVELSIEDLMLQKPRLQLFRNLITGNSHEFRLGGFLDDPQLELEGTRVCVPLGTEVMLGDYRGILVTSVWGELKYTGQEREGEAEYAILTSERRVEAAFAVRTGEEPSPSLNAAVHAVADAHAEETCLILEQYAT